MPKETFYNLTEEKRTRILDAALTEFSKYNFGEASVARIIKTSGIAAGSFYQYFDNKLDLYRELMHSVQDKKMRYLSPVLKDEKAPFFELFRKLYESGIRFATENPRMESLGRRLMNDKDLLNKTMKDLESLALDFYAGLIKRGIASGDIREDIDIGLTAFFLFKTGTFISEYILREEKISETAMEDVSGIINLIENGIGNK